MNLLSGLTNDKLIIHADNLVRSHPNIAYDDFVARLHSYSTLKLH